MGRKIEIAQHVNLLDEAFLLLYYWINKDSMEENRAKYADNYQLNIESYNKRFDTIIEIYNYVKDNLKAKKDIIEYYFKERNTDYSTYCALAVLWDYHNYDNNLQSYGERFNTITNEQKIKEYAKIINMEEAMNTSGDELRTISDLIAFIEASPYEKEAKWEAIKIYNNQEIYYKEALSILTEVMELINRKYSQEISEIEQEFYEYWKEYQKADDVINTINEKINVSWSYSEKGSIVVPLIFFPFSVTISIDEVESRSSDVIRISVMLDNRFILVGNKLKKEDVVNIGKLLCDKSKVDILEYVSKKPGYGKEIAKELNLSTATISYHVNALLKIGFLKAEVNANKVYYSMDKERISSYLENVRDYFIEL
ncbi:MAG: transcriptional regulator, ArsR family [Herbinix sp.]|jgi:predicted DNA-binding transcriptional regulator|nr:transcriptional regulator, ArsR family [Herbinix sp.]